MRKKHLYLTFTLVSFTSYAQNLQPGFEKREYTELLKVFSRWGDLTFYQGIQE
jgi:hypothetical protein